MMNNKNKNTNKPVTQPVVKNVSPAYISTFFHPVFQKPVIKPEPMQWKHYD